MKWDPGRRLVLKREEQRQREKGGIVVAWEDVWNMMNGDIMVSLFLLCFVLRGFIRLYMHGLVLLNRQAGVISRCVLLLVYMSNHACSLVVWYTGPQAVLHNLSFLAFTLREQP